MKTCVHLMNLNARRRVRSRLLVRPISLVLVLAMGTVGQACTTFVLCDGNSVVFGKNYDWVVDDGLVITNRRGIEKTALVRQPLLNWPVKWTSKYGSVTFNQFGWELPTGGINEVGLVVETMLLFESKYPPKDKRAAIGMMQWVQYQLDNCRTVDEVIATNEKIRIVGDPKVKMGLHYLVADATGKAASIEFLDGKMVCHSGPDLPLKVLANLPYKECLAYVETEEGDASKSLNSLPRFSKASSSVKEFGSENPTADRDYAFKTLDSVVSGNAQTRTKTLWTIVYDIAKRRVYYRTNKNPKLRWVFMEDFDFSPKVSSRYLDINAGGEGHVAAKTQVLTHNANAKYVREGAIRNKEETKKLMGDSKAAMEFYLFFIRRNYQPKTLKSQE
jgi:penicillin V acylase-like amidase (Ntn superfamily)